MKVIVSATRDPVAFLRLTGSLKNRLAMLGRNYRVVFTREYEKRGLDLVYLGKIKAQPGFRNTGQVQRR